MNCLKFYTTFLILIACLAVGCASEDATKKLLSTTTQNPQPTNYPTSASYPATPGYSQTSLTIPNTLNDTYINSTGTWSVSQLDLWGLLSTGATSVFSQLSLPNNELIVAVIDSGTDYGTSDLDGRLWVNHGEEGNGKETNGIDDDGNGYVDDFIGWNWVHNNNNPLDDNGHGTHVAGTIAALGGNGLGIVGVAPWVRIMSLKVCDYRGSCSTNNVRDAIRYAADNGAKIINLSLGGQASSADNTAFDGALSYAVSLGTIPIVAAGNSSADVISSSPANSNYAVAVSAHASDRLLCSTFSNFGLKIDISAPGCGFDGQSEVAAILSLNSRKCGPSGHESCCSRTTPDGQYCLLKGTSMAAPHVSGLAAIALTASSQATPYMVRQSIIKSASLADGQSLGQKNILYGAGIASALVLPTYAAQSIGVKITSPRFLAISNTHNIAFTVQSRSNPVTYQIRSKLYNSETNFDFLGGTIELSSQPLAPHEQMSSTLSWQGSTTGTYLITLEATDTVTNERYNDVIALRVP